MTCSLIWPSQVYTLVVSGLLTILPEKHIYELEYSGFVCESSFQHLIKILILKYFQLWFIFPSLHSSGVILFICNTVRFPCSYLSSILGSPPSWLILVLPVLALRNVTKFLGLKDILPPHPCTLFLFLPASPHTSYRCTVFLILGVIFPVFLLYKNQNKTKQKHVCFLMLLSLLYKGQHTIDTLCFPFI